MRLIERTSVARQITVTRIADQGRLCGEVGSALARERNENENYCQYVTCTPQPGAAPGGVASAPATRSLDGHHPG